MKDLHDRFENWYRLTHWMSPPLTRRESGSGEYENSIVEAMYFAYRAGYNRSNKEHRTKVRPQNWSES